MEPIVSVVDTIKGFAKSGDQFVKDAFQRIRDRHRHSPIETLKRLQRESFSDLMKLRDRQDKVERIFTSLKSVKWIPFQEGGTHMNGIISIGGALSFHGEQQARKLLQDSGLNTDTNARFIFKSNLREKDALVAEFLSSCRNVEHDHTGSPLVLTKLMYAASITDLVSVILMPLGAMCSDFQFDTDNMQGSRMPGFCSLRPPLFLKSHPYAVGLTINASNFAASFAELASGSDTQPIPDRQGGILSTFGELFCQPLGEMKLTLSGVWEMPISYSQPIRLGRSSNAMSSDVQTYSNSDEIKSDYSSSVGKQMAASTGGSICVKIDIDESTKFGSWVEVHNSSPSLLKWAISLSDMPEYETGWSMIVGGSTEGHSSSLLLGSFLNFNIGKSASLQPGIALTMSEGCRTPALLLQSSRSQARIKEEGCVRPRQLA